MYKHIYFAAKSVCSQLLQGSASDRFPFLSIISYLALLVLSRVCPLSVKVFCLSLLRSRKNCMQFSTISILKRTFPCAFFSVFAFNVTDPPLNARERELEIKPLFFLLVDAVGRPCPVLRFWTPTLHYTTLSTIASCRSPGTIV